MKKMKKFRTLSKRATAVFVSVMMCVGILQTEAFAKTIEARLDCNLEEHTHSEACYSSELICGTEETASHQHTEACYEVVYTTSETPTCGETEAENYHVHDQNCLGEDGYVDPDKCQEAEYTGHIHTSECYQVAERVLVCGEEESEPHTHTDACYAPEALTCEKEEHVHTSDCYNNSHVYDELYISLKEQVKDADEAADLEDENNTNDIVLILNGTTLDMNKYQGGNIRVDLDGKTLTIKDGAIAGGTIEGTGGQRVITILNGGSVVLEGSTTITGGGSSGGAGVYVGKDSSFTMNGGSISGNATATTGGGVMVEGGQFTMNGGAISDNHADEKGSFDTKGNPDGKGGGVYVTGGGQFTMNGGTISGNTAGEGGGVFVDTSGKKANGETYGSSNLTMNGGAIDGNTALYGEGGGIYIKGTGEITRGQITNNETKTQKDLGGGGIYIEITGVLNLKNAIITDNYAAGLGGGIAACVHGKTVVYMTQGALVYGNQADGSSYSQGYGTTTTNGVKIDGHAWWWDSDQFKDGAQDIFAASDAQVNDSTTNAYGAGAIYVSSSVLGGGDANWSGFIFAYDANGKLICDEHGKPVWQPVDADGNIVYSDKLLGITAAPDEDTIKAAEEAAAAAGGVLISGNKSATHGGGIGNNGLLVIGKGPFEETEGDDTLDLKKELETPEGSDRVLQEGEFNFSVRPQKAPENATPVEILTGRNDKDGNVSFEFPEGTFTEVGIYTFLVQEEIPKNALLAEDGTYYTEDENGNRVIYDNSLYEVVIEVTADEVHATLGNGENAEDVTLRTITIGTPVIYKVVIDENGNPQRVQKQELDENGNPVFDENGDPVYVLDANGDFVYETVDGITFNNTYTEVENPGDDDDDDDDIIPGDDDDDDDDDFIPGDDDDDDDDFTPPEDPTPETPDTPDEPVIPETEEETVEEFTPPAEEPEEIPEEIPEEEILEDPTPLADIPVEEEPVEESDEEVELPDEDIPLTDVPLTGDSASIWYYVMGLTAIGIVILRVQERKREEDNV